MALPSESEKALLVIWAWRVGVGVGEEGGEGRGGEGKGGPHLQQQLQAATESVQLSTGVCHGLSAPVTLDDGRDSSCGEGGGHRTAASEGPEGEAP